MSKSNRTTLIRLNLPFSNAYLLRGNKNVLIDTGSPYDLSILTWELHQYGVSVNNIALIVLTHVHFDHAGAAAEIQKIAGCPIAVHHLEKENFEKGQNAPIVPIHPLGKVLTPFMGIDFHPASIDISIENEFDLSEYKVDAQVIFTPGHTPGSVSVLTADREAIVGDLVGGGWPLGQFRPDKPRYHYWASNMEDVQASLRNVFSYQPETIYVGHGGPLDGNLAKAFFLEKYS
jgi:glyoxylase-like metal-dependent hydrolase (beta-lactamase superfamily II)